VKGRPARVLFNLPEYSGPCGCTPDLREKPIYDHQSSTKDTLN
jgi:hypothetical protein